MRNYFFYTLLILLPSCMDQQKEPASGTKTEIQHPCAGLKDTAIHRVFKLTTAVDDLPELVKFIEGRGELKQYQDKGMPAYFKDTGIVLTRILCEDDNYNPPIERWFLDSVFTISTSFKLVKEVSGAKGIFGTIHLTQCNFDSETEKEKALALFQKASWGDPQHKWNEYSLLSHKNRIYILEPSLAMMTDPLHRCLKALEEKWR